MAQVVHAAGAVVWRVRRERLEVLLIHRPSYDDWSWPKGKPRKREPLPACAIREVNEETGVEVVLGVPLPKVKYRLANGKRKINSYWAAQPAASEEPVAARAEVEPAPPSEVDEAVWVDAVKALTMLTRRGDREPLKGLLDLYADGELATWAVLLTRHGTAKKRSAWEGSELSRPLTPAGEEQARALVPLFGVRRPPRTHPPWARCEAVAPFAACGGVGSRRSLPHREGASGIRKRRKTSSAPTNGQRDRVHAPPGAADRAGGREEACPAPRAGSFPGC